MATNLRLRPETEAAVRAEAERSGRSQQDVMRDAIDRYLGVPAGVRSDTLGAFGPASARVQPPRRSYARPARRVSLRHGVTTLDLLDRNDR